MILTSWQNWLHQYTPFPFSRTATLHLWSRALSWCVKCHTTLESRAHGSALPSLFFWSSFSSQMSPETVHPDSTLCKVGERGDRMWVLTSGSVNLLDGDGDISTSLTATELVTPAFGELCLFEDSPDRQFTIVTTTQAEVRVLTGVQLKECFADHPGAESAMRMWPRVCGVVL